MAFIKLYDGGGDDRAAAAQCRLRNTLGFVPETHQAMSRSGPFLEAMLSLDHAAGANLDEKTRQLITIAVSAANGCGYCVHAHRALAIKAGCTDEDVSGAMEIAAMMSAYNTFNKAAGLIHDVTPESLGVAATA